jgi:ATP-dependent Clp protease ATP-binding subunit ClpA
MPKYTDNTIENFSIFERLSKQSKDFISSLKPYSRKEKKVDLQTFYSVLASSTPVYLPLLEKYELPFDSNRKVKLDDWLISSYYEAYLSGSETVEVIHLLLSFLLNFDIELYYQVKKDYHANGSASEKSGLKDYFEDLTQSTGEENETYFIGREKELTRIMVNLSTGTSNPILLMGNTGIGKSRLIQELAYRIKKNLVPENLKGARVMRISFPRLMSIIPSDTNVSVHLLFSHLLNTIADIEKIPNQKTILFLDDIRIGAGLFIGIDTNSTKNGQVMLIGASREDYSEKSWDTNIYSTWDVLNLDEQTDKENIEILKSYARHKQKKTNIKFTDNAISKILEESKDELVIDSMPGGGIKTVDMLTVYKNFNRPDKGSKIVDVTEEDVEEFLGGNPRNNKDHNKDSVISKDKLKNLEKDLKKVIIGQDNALEAIARALRVSSLKLYNTSRPIGTFLFLGPTGVGKTETAKAIARYLFGYRDKGKSHPNNFLRVDMSEYTEKHSVSKLFGAPPGYIGYDDSSSVTDFVRDNPVCLILFDEIDKAHPEVLNSLLHIMDEGEIRNNQGEMISFEDVIVIMTSNHGAEQLIKNYIGFESQKGKVMEIKEIENILLSYIKKQLKPEFLNRFDEIIIFDILRGEDIFKILDNMIKPLVSKLKIMDIKLTISSKVKHHLIDKANITEFGARDLRRHFNKKIIDTLSRILLENDNVKKIHISIKNDEVFFKN